MDDPVKIPSYAKVNLGLRILEKRNDGFHNIESIFQTVSLKDEIHFYFSHTGVKVECEDDRVPGGHDNLVYKAVEEFRDRTGISVDVSIRIIKNIPVAGGMGGGSSNAAATLLVLNQFYSAGLNDYNLMEMAADIGSDVPFFIRGGTALIRGRGEIIEWQDDIPELEFLVVTFLFGIPAEEAYEMWDSGPDETLTNRDLTVILKLLINGNKGVINNLRNSFTEFVVKEYPQISTVFNMLKQMKPVNILMSGSGPTVISIFGSSSDVVRAREKMRENGFTSRICRTISRQDYCNSLKLKED